MTTEYDRLVCENNALKQRAEAAERSVFELLERIENLESDVELAESYISEEFMEQYENEARYINGIRECC